jgi:hypothetical protein
MCIIFNRDLLVTERPLLRRLPTLLVSRWSPRSDPIQGRYSIQGRYWGRFLLQALFQGRLRSVPILGVPFG